MTNAQLRAGPNSLHEPSQDTVIQPPVVPVVFHEPEPVEEEPSEHTLISAPRTNSPAADVTSVVGSFFKGLFFGKIDRRLPRLGEGRVFLYGSERETLRNIGQALDLDGDGR